MKTVLLLVLLALSGFAAAQTVDQKLCTVITFEGKKYGEVCGTYYGLEPADLKLIRTHMLKIADTASKQKDTGGPFVVTLTETITDAAGKTTDSPALEFRGLKLSSVAKIVRAESKAGDDLLKLVEKMGDKGKDGSGKAWGKKK
jgi:hypothetical protein